MHTSYQLGEKICIPPPFFSSPFNHFFPQHFIWPFFLGGGAGQTEKYTPLRLKQKKYDESFFLVKYLFKNQEKVNRDPFFWDTDPDV